MVTNTRELWFAFAAIILITIFYLLVVILLGGIPAASGFFGHSLGVLGFVLMVMTETLYTLRKRTRDARWGRMSSWLQFHIFTGLVGPYLVLLHSSWKFNGLAGIVMLMTGMVVLSGFIGRYIYTAIPRTADGLEVTALALQRHLRVAEAELNGWLAKRPEASRYFSGQLVVAGPVAPVTSKSFIFGRGNPLARWVSKLRMDATTRNQLIQLENLISRRDRLSRQATALLRARRWLAIWHTVHIPLGLALFTAAIIHMLAAIYYATLLR
jgi:hypothetical protein